MLPLSWRGTAAATESRLVPSRLAAAAAATPPPPSSALTPAPAPAAPRQVEALAILPSLPAPPPGLVAMMLRAGRVARSDLLHAGEALALGGKLGELLARQQRRSTASAAEEAEVMASLLARARAAAAVSRPRLRSLPEVVRRYADPRVGSVHELIGELLAEACGHAGGGGGAFKVAPPQTPDGLPANRAVAVWARPVAGTCANTVSLCVSTCVEMKRRIRPA
ncbi:hypothetical protein GPECTOR_38g345 [Gonium pectorale]|uniref:Uncharacterized protein n=1 Tax=Gonium pectorale TaxID=33097 RepID=A0A150GBB1_GONPE|nr:hypothetical protein GPECTOR_38g345 [Gonium pectorale]|eukprot:KXZ47108.1 hypothetical protein GPECTOR_38g345 [Gonium pectorale]